MKQIELDRFFWWDGAKIGNVSFESCDAPIRLTEQSFLNPTKLLPFNVFQRGPIRLNLDYIRRVGEDEDILSESATALKATNVSLNWHNMLYPVVDIAADDVDVHVFFKTTGLSLWTSVEVPVPSVTLGDWTVNELIKMIPEPPEEEGLYPRLGVIDIRNVTIHTFSCEGEVKVPRPRYYCEEDKFAIPNEFFSPLNHLTRKAGPEGVDQMHIENILKEATMTVFRKNILKEEAIMKSVSRSTTFIETIRQFLEEFLKESGKVLKHHLSLILDAIEDMLEKWEGEWLEVLTRHEKKASIFKNEWKEGWDALKKSALHFEAGLEDILKGFEEHAWKDVKRDVDKGWKIAKKHAKNIESNMGGMMDQFERSVESKWQQVKEGIEQDFGGWNNFVEYHLKTMDAKFQNLEKKTERMWNEVRNEVDVDFARERVEEARKIVLKKWGHAKSRLSSYPAKRTEF